MVQRTALTFDNEALLDAGGDPVINNSDTPNGTVFTYQAGFSARPVSIDDTDNVNVFDDDDTADHEILDGRGLVANGQSVESESVIVLRELDGNGNQIGPNITIFVFSQGGVTQNVWGFATNTTLTPGTSYVKITGSNNGDSLYADFVCFASGSLLRTPDGDCAVEHIQPGDRVWTQNNPSAAVSWTGSRTIYASGDFAPVRIEAGVLGNRSAVTLSPRHRVIIRHSACQLMFGLDNVLLQARDLVALDGINQLPATPITYHHIMFDRHEIVDCDGLLTESFYAGAEALNLLDETSKAELIELFPELGHRPGAFGKFAAPTLRRYEAQVLSQTLAAQMSASRYTC